MRIAVISDIHGNWHAFEAVLADIANEGADEVWCLGDIVGYGPQPNRCVEEARTRSDICLLGNHDLAALGEVDLATFSPDAATSARWTIDELEPDALEYLKSLEPKGERDGVELFHGSPRDPVWEYLLSEPAVRTALEMTTREARARRPQPHPDRAPALRRRARSRAASRRAAARSTSTRGAGCSTRARSASRATATRARRTC